jgi:hypothetical protein
MNTLKESVVSVCKSIQPLRHKFENYILFFPKLHAAERTIMQKKKQETSTPVPSKIKKKNVWADGRDRAKGIEVVCSLTHRLLTASHSTSTDWL